MHKVIPAANWVRWAGLSALLAVAGCGGPRYDYVGSWQGNRNLPVPEGGDPAVIRTLGEIRLDILRTGRFNLFEAGAPKSGTYRESNGRAYLKVDSYFGKPLSEADQRIQNQHPEIELVPVDVQTVRYVDPKGFDPRPIELRRASQPPSSSVRN